MFLKMGFIMLRAIKKIVEAYVELVIQASEMESRSWVLSKR